MYSGSSNPMASELDNHYACENFTTPCQTDDNPDGKPKSCSQTAHRDKFFLTPEKKCNLTVYNPFENEIESLSMPSFSPSVFQESVRLDEDENKPFSWSIDQIAILAPADIDETSHQDTYQELDFELEQKAQKAIEKFFSHNSIVPSPWGMTRKEVTFSPKITPVPCTTKQAKTNSSSNSKPKQQGKEVWTQTVLSIPPEVDILARLGDFCTFHGDQYEQRCYEEEDEESNDAKDLLSASLRRKLFTIDRNSVTPRNDRDPVTHDGKMFSSPLLPWKTPEKQITSYLTPESAQFSSSPISANCSISSNIHLQSLSSPPVSPICKSEMKTPSMGNAKNHNKRNRTPTVTSSPIARSLSEDCKWTDNENFERPPPLQRNATELAENFIDASARLSLSMLSEENEDDKEQTQEMHSEVSIDICGTYPRPLPAVTAFSHDTGYQTKSYQSVTSQEIVSVGSTTRNPNDDYTTRNEIRECNVGVSDSQIEISSMEVEFFHHRHSEPNTNCDMQNSDSINNLQAGWKPSVCSTPYL